jgi:hypothetical protein
VRQGVENLDPPWWKKECVLLVKEVDVEVVERGGSRSRGRVLSSLVALAPRWELYLTYAGGNIETAGCTPSRRREKVEVIRKWLWQGGGSGGDNGDEVLVRRFGGGGGGGRVEVGMRDGVETRDKRQRRWWCLRGGAWCFVVWVYTRQPGAQPAELPLLPALFGLGGRQNNNRSRIIATRRG